MKKARRGKHDPDLLDEYDFSKGVRGKYAKRYAQGTNIVKLDPDLRPYFPTSDAVNEALRALLEVARRTKKM